MKMVIIYDIDWSVTARLDELYINTYREEGSACKALIVAPIHAMRHRFQKESGMLYLKFQPPLIFSQQVK